MTFDNMDKVEKEYTNGEITVVWKPHLCDHSAVCISELPDVFDSIKRPWIKMNGAPTNAIKRVVDLCPTRALTWYANKESEDLTKQNENATEITLVKDEPIRLSGNFKIIDENGNSITCADKVSLCRCTKSQRLPYCDGSHREL